MLDTGTGDRFGKVRRESGADLFQDRCTRSSDWLLRAVSLVATLTQ